MLGVDIQTRAKTWWNWLEHGSWSWHQINPFLYFFSSIFYLKKLRVFQTLFVKLKSSNAPSWWATQMTKTCTALKTTVTLWLQSSAQLFEASHHHNRFLHVFCERAFSAGCYVTACSQTHRALLHRHHLLSRISWTHRDQTWWRRGWGTVGATPRLFLFFLLHL